MLWLYDLAAVGLQQPTNFEASVVATEVLTTGVTPTTPADI